MQCSFTAYPYEILVTVILCQCNPLYISYRVSNFFSFQAAYHTAKPPALEEQLKQLELNEDKVS